MSVKLYFHRHLYEKNIGETLFLIMKFWNMHSALKWNNFFSTNELLFIMSSSFIWVKKNGSKYPHPVREMQYIFCLSNLMQSKLEIINFLRWSWFNVIVIEIFNYSQQYHPSPNSLSLLVWPFGFLKHPPLRPEWSCRSSCGLFIYVGWFFWTLKGGSVTFKSIDVSLVHL